MITELEELISALGHQTEACYRIVENKKRTHAFSIIQLLVDIEAGLVARKQDKLAGGVKGMINTCANCISTTAIAGKTYKCIRSETCQLKNDAEKIDHVRWERITFAEPANNLKPKYLKKK